MYKQPVPVVDPFLAILGRGIPERSKSTPNPTMLAIIIVRLLVITIILIIIGRTIIMDVRVVATVIIRVLIILQVDMNGAAPASAPRLNAGIRNPA